MDLISRQAAIDAMAKEMPQLTTPDGSGQFDHEIHIADEAFVDAMQIIHDLPSAEPLTEEDYNELRDRFGEYVEFVVRDMISRKGDRWKKTT